MKFIENILNICFTLILLTEVFCDIGNPYQILGVDKKATTQDIRRAYKQLAKEW